MTSPEAAGASDEGSATASSRDDRPVVEFVELPAAALRALLQGDLAGATALAQAPLTPFFLQEEWLWRIRLPQVEADHRLVSWVAQAAVIDGRVVGHAGFHAAPDADGIVEVGYAVDPQFRGRGYAKAMLGALIQRVRTDPQVVLVRASIQPENWPSIAVATSFGFRPVSEAFDDEDGLEVVHELVVGDLDLPA